MTGRSEQSWYFSFCYDSENASKYVEIFGTYENARMEMFRRYGTAWAFQYESKELAGIERWGMTRLGPVIQAGGGHD